MKLVIPCAGRGTRLGLNVPKALTKVNSRSLLGHITCFWSSIVDEYIIVVSPSNQAAVMRESGKATFVLQDKPNGLADAILCTEPYIEGKFILNLGDCLCRGTFDEIPLGLGIGVWSTRNLYEVNKSYHVDSVVDNNVRHLVEKPNIEQVTTELNCGMGIYFLDERVFKYIRNIQIEPGDGDFTEVLQNMISNGEEITPVVFRGDYINVTYPQDIKRAEEIFK